MKPQKRGRPTKNATSESANWSWPADTDEISNLIGSLQKLFSSLGIKNSISLSRRSTRDRPSKQHALPSATIVGNLLTKWHQDAMYLDRFGEPVPLPFDGRRMSFKELCRKVAPSASAQHVLKKFIKLGVVEQDEMGLVIPTTRSLPMYNDSELATAHTIRALRDFVDTLDHNLRIAHSPRDHLFFRMAWNGDLPTEKIPRLKIWLRRHGQDLLESADSWMADAARGAGRKQTARTPRAQATVGIYLALRKNKSRARP